MAASVRAYEALIQVIARLKKQKLYKDNAVRTPANRPTPGFG